MRRGSSPSPPGGCGPRSCGCPRAPSRRRGRPSRRRPRSPPAAGRSCRCRSCSRSRPCGSRAARGTASARRGRSTRSRPSSPERGSSSPRACSEAALDRLLRQQPGADHHLRVRRVRAGRDRGDHDAAVLELVVGAGDRDASCGQGRPPRPASRRARARRLRPAPARSSGRWPGRCRRRPCRGCRS